ncbi:MAG: TonB-dependent receptor plug domain-containing protein [Paludibacter sp.]
MKNTILLKQLAVLLFCFITIANLSAQDIENRFHVRAKIIDARTKKGIKKIPITVLPFNRIINADNKGGFLFNMPKGNYSFVLDYFPFEKQEVKLDLQSDTTLLIELHTTPGVIYLSEVEVLASRPATEMPAAIEQIDGRQLKSLPSMIGERDILKAFSLTAGVTSSSEGAADMQVRGGLHGQNLYLLDGIPLYSTEHFFGMVSVYNPTIIKSATLYKSGFPAEYGGKISSVINVHTEDADLKKFKGEAEIGMLTSKLALNIPLVKDKLALSLAGRISNYSIVDIISPLLPESLGTRFGVHFGDINANLFWKISEKDRLKLTFLSNTDGFDVKSNMFSYISKTWFKNHQQNLGLNWYKTISAKTDNHLLAYTDIYGYDFGISQQQLNPSSLFIGQALTGINSMGLVEKINYKISEKINLNAGVSFKSFGFSPIHFNINDSNVNSMKVTDQIRLNEGVVFAESDYQLAKQQTLTAGLRLSTIGNQDKTFSNLEPRIAYHGIFPNDYSISASAGRMTQPVHRVANSGLGFSFEMFYPSSSILQPESSWNISLGGAKDFSWKNQKLSVKVDAWYKTMENIVEFQDGYDAYYSVLYAVQSNIIGNTKKYLAQGNGKAYGIDFSASYDIKNLRLTADYTLMKAENQFAQLNMGRPFAAPTDIRNSLSLTSELKLSESWSFTATWQYNSGKPITVPTYIFSNPSSNYKPLQAYDYDGTDYQRVVTERNNYRTKPFHKLDVSFNHNYKTRKKHLDARISLGIYNVYNRANPYLYYIDGVPNADRTYTPVLKSMSMFPVLPSFSWSVKF